MNQTDYLFSNEGFVSHCIFPWCKNRNKPECLYLNNKYMQMSVVNESTLFLLDGQTIDEINSLCADCLEFETKHTGE